jgi:hypothetical protein
VTRNSLVFDTAYARWRAKFLAVEVGCFDSVCEFVSVHFDRLIERYYLEGHESIRAFPAWAFEHYLREVTGGASYPSDRRPARRR